MSQSLTHNCVICNESCADNDGVASVYGNRGTFLEAVMPSATGQFEVTLWQENTYRELEGGGKLTRASVTQTFSGDISGSGDAEGTSGAPSRSNTARRLRPPQAGCSDRNSRTLASTAEAV